MVELIVGLIVAGVIYWALQQLVFPYLDPQIRNVVRVLVIVLVIIYAVKALATLL